MKQFHTHIATLILTALGALAAHAVELETTQPVAAKTNGEKWWNGNCERILSDIKKTNGKVDVGFVGDSITARWRGRESWEKHWGRYNAVNMGIGGDRTQNVLWRLQNGGLDGYKAKLFVVMIGTNNLWDKKALRNGGFFFPFKNPKSTIINLFPIFPISPHPLPSSQPKTCPGNSSRQFIPAKRSDAGKPKATPGRLSSSLQRWMFSVRCSMFNLPISLPARWGLKSPSEI